MKFAKLSHLRQLLLAFLLVCASIKAPAATIEAAFSPDGNAEQLVLRSINSARQSIRLATYTFTAPPVVQALRKAHARGVDVAVVADEKAATAQDGSGKMRAALNLLVNAGIPVNVVSRYTIMHDKFMVVDGLHVQTGSYNYTAAAARYNSENVLVIWDDPATAAAYLRHWQRRYNQGRAWQPGY